MKTALLQQNFLPGALEENAKQIIDTVKRLANEGCEVCVSPELALTGCIACDYYSYPAFIEASLAWIDEIRIKLKDCDCALALGAIGISENNQIFNRAIFLYNGAVAGFADKKNLSAREKAYFCSGAGPSSLVYKNKKYTLALGGDINECLQNFGDNSDKLVIMDASFFIAEELAERQKNLIQQSITHNKNLIYANACGAIDGKIFSGASMVIKAPDVIRQAKIFEPDILISSSSDNIARSDFIDSESPSVIYKALVFALRQYCEKIKIDKAVIGLSGGIDSALVAVIACDAIGADNVTGLLMPSPWSSEHSVTDALALAANTGMRTFTIPVKELINAYEISLKEPFSGKKKDVTEENIQARIRGNIVMATANKLNAIALATGNRSEIAVGYCTIYGDTCGALEVIGDLYKTEVYKISKYLNGIRNGIIPENILLKAPSAELRPGQKDSDSLPPYETLDAILSCLLDKHLDVNDIVHKGYEQETVEKVAKLVAKAQFKRMQTAPAIQVHAPAHLNMPICGKFPFNPEKPA